MCCFFPFSPIFSVAGRIQALDAISDVQASVPWVQSKPRFSVVDNQQRSVPDSQPIIPPAESPANTTNESDGKFETQIKMNAELLHRIEKLEEEKLAIVEEKKKLQALLDKINKENVFYKAKCGQSNVAAPLSSGKENVDP